MRNLYAFTQQSRIPLFCITSKEDITSVFECVKKGLKPGGVFIFDLKTIHFFRDVLAENTYAENRDDSAFIWDNYYDEETRNNEYDLAVFIKNEDESFIRRIVNTDTTVSRLI